MGLQLFPIIKEGPGRRRMRLDIEVDAFLRLLQNMDGKRRIRAEGLPKDVRCVGLRADHVFNTVSLLLESADWPEVPPEYTLPTLDVTFREFTGSAMPQEPDGVEEALHAPAR